MNHTTEADEGTTTIQGSSNGSDKNVKYPSSPEKVLDKRQLFMWVTQMVASLSWLAACLIYNSYEHGDIWQFVSPSVQIKFVCFHF
mmetsp:Transcript_12905/g.28509  ORF Transcript_12905/g.28509 Transcript_12905/m.28509 type:complete len:86 (-) Transcript_12905:556-813(-)